MSHEWTRSRTSTSESFDHLFDSAAESLGKEYTLDQYIKFIDNNNDNNDNNDNNGNGSVEETFVLVYPLDILAINRVSITASTLNRLKSEGTAGYFNTDLIDLGMKYLIGESSHFHVMSSHFLTKLMKDKYEGVQTWTNRVDLFQQHCILIPLVKDCHWSLFVIVGPGCLLRPGEVGSSSDNMCCIMHFDSLRNSEAAHDTDSFGATLKK